MVEGEETIMTKEVIRKVDKGSIQGEYLLAIED